MFTDFRKLVQVLAHKKSAVFEHKSATSSLRILFWQIVSAVQ